MCEPLAIENAADLADYTRVAEGGEENLNHFILAQVTLAKLQYDDD